MKQEPLIESRMGEEIRIPLKALTRVTIACLGSQGKPCEAETTVDLAATRPQKMPNAQHVEATSITLP